MDEINFQVEYEVFTGSNPLIAVLSLAIFMATLKRSIIVVDILPEMIEDRCAVHFYYQFIRGNDEEPY